MVDKEYKQLMKERELLYAELTKDFTSRQFELLIELIDNEIQMEKWVSQ